MGMSTSMLTGICTIALLWVLAKPFVFYSEDRQLCLHRIEPLLMSFFGDWVVIPLLR